MNVSGSNEPEQIWVTKIPFVNRPLKKIIILLNYMLFQLQFNHIHIWQVAPWLIYVLKFDKYERDIEQARKVRWCITDVCA